jgi:ribonuclease P protein component
MTPHHTYTLGKNLRLKSRKSIDAIFKTGQKVNASPCKAFFIIQPFTGKNNPGAQFGVGVAKRYFKHAVDRNRIKRQMREAWRLQKNPLQELLVQQNQIMQVFVIFTANELPQWELLHEKVAILLNKLLHEAGKSHTQTS